MDSLRAYDSLESAILTGRLKPRERMVEQELAEQLNMSRTPIREALRRLEERGLVRILPRRGAVVSDISQADVENIYAVRSTLEVLASQLAVERIGPEGMERVREMEAAHASLAVGGDVRGLMLANDRFHDAIYIAAGNPCLFEIIQQLRRQVHAVRFNAWSRPDRIARSVAEHHQILQALTLRDSALLIELTREHLRVARELYLAHLGRRPEPPVRAEAEGQAMTAALGQATAREGPTSPMDLRSRSE